MLALRASRPWTVSRDRVTVTVAVAVTVTDDAVPHSAAWIAANASHAASVPKRLVFDNNRLSHFDVPWGVQMLDSVLDGTSAYRIRQQTSNRQNQLR